MDVGIRQRNRLWPTTIALWALALAASSLSPVRACDTPVFQYALDWWEAEDYEAHVFLAGPLTADQEAALRLLREAEDDNGIRPSNLRLEVYGPAAPGEPVAAPPPDFPVPKERPGLVVLYPKGTGLAAPLWSGPLASAEVQALLDSPMRQEIARQLCAGKAAVWILIESGSAREDNAAYTLLQNELRRMEQVLSLPVPAPDDVTEGEPPAAAPPPLRPSFAWLRVARELREERMLVRMLLGSELELAKLGRTPLVFPVFGRGLVLYALAGQGINERNLARAATFIVGPCSCEIKGGNPGTDLLMPQDWSAGAESATAPPLVGIAGFGANAEQARAPTAGFLLPPVAKPDAVTATADRQDAYRLLLVAIAGGVLLAALAAILLVVGAKTLLQLRNRDQEPEP